MGQVASALNEQRDDILADDPRYLFFNGLPEIVRGAYVFFGDNSIDELVYQTTGNPNLRALQVAGRAYVDSPLCEKNAEPRLVSITWSESRKKLIVDRDVANKLLKTQEATPTPITWDFKDRATAETWNYNDFDHTFTDAGVVLSIPSNPTHWIESPTFEGLFGGGYRQAEVEFVVIDENTKPGTRKIRLAWRANDTYKSGGELTFGYGTKTSSVDQNIPLCRFLDWSLTDNITGIRLLPIQSGTVLLKSVTLR
jgi:hypothetical protein